MVRGRGIRVVAGLLAVSIVGGMVTLGAEAANASGSLGLPILDSITVSPSVASIVQGQTQQFTATGLFSDGTLQTITNDLMWSGSSSSGSVASVDPTGLVNGLSAGEESITATAPAGLLGLLSPLTGTAILTVLPVLDSITMSPSFASLTEGQTQQFSATGLFSNGTTQIITNDLTWSSASGALASVTNTGLATGLAPGLDTITATAPAGLPTGPLAGLLTPLTSAANLTVLGGSSGSPSPLFTMTPTTGKKRAVVAAQGSNFSPGESVIVSYLSGLKARKRASTVLFTTTTDSSGSFACQGVIPRASRSGKVGKHTVTAVVSSNQSTSTIFDLVRGIAPAT